MQKHILQKLIFLAILLAFASPIFAQSFRGGINGTVTDSTGAVVPGATVIATDVATNVTYKTVSSSAGDFTITNLPLGTYTVTISSTGFSTAKYTSVEIGAGAAYTLPAKLAISSTTQTVEVQAAALTLDTVTDVQATVIPDVVVQNLPNSGRDFTQMISQTPGFAGLSTGGGAGAASVNGSRSNSVNWQIEGTDNNDLWWNIPAVNQGGVSAIAGVVFPIDAIQDFSFVTSGATGLGRNPGGTANLTIKSGGNSLHGTAYFSEHNELFEKKNPFLSSKAESRLVDYGFSVGGPIIENKFFFFIAGEKQTFLIGAENAGTEPSAAYQTLADQDLAYYGITPTTLSHNLLYGNGTLPGLWPTSSLTGPASAGNYVPVGSNLTGHSFNGLIKLDAKLTAKDTLSARWYVGQGTQTAPTSSELPVYYENAPIHVQNYSIIYNRIINATMTNQLSAGVSYFNQVFSDADTNFNPIGLGLNTGVTDPALPGSPHLIIGPGSSGSGLTSGSNTGFDPLGVTAPSGRNDITGHIDEDFTWVKGKHQMHFGGEFRQAQVDDFYQTGQRGTIYFDGTQGPWNPADVGSTGYGANANQTPCLNLATKNQGKAAPVTDSNVIELADFLAGCIDGPASSIVLGNPKRQVFVNTFDIYGQDNFQVTKRLNINYGLRYDYEGPVHSDFPNLSIFDPALPSGLGVAGQDVPNIYGKFWKAWSPRFGFAYQLDASGKTVLRGGAGLYYDSLYMKSILQNNGAQNISVFGPGLNPAGSEEVANAGGNNAVITPGVDIFPTLSQALSASAAGGESISTFDPNFRPSDTAQWDLNIQRSLSNSVVAQVGYLGTRGSHLTGLFDINSPGNTGGAAPYAAQFPQFGVIDEARSNLGSIYHSLQTTLKLQSWHGLTTQLAYTWSHALDYETGLLPYLPQDPYNEKAEYGNSDFDVRNTLTGYLDYTVPTFAGPRKLMKGWEVNSGFSFHGGTPYTVVASNADLSGNGDYSERAVQVIKHPNAVNHAIVGGSVQWFNPNAFVDGAPGTYSPTRRGQNSNPGYSAVDVAAIKTTELTDRFKLQIKANIYNIFNHTNLAPVGLPSTGEGGTISSTIGPYLGNPTIGPGEPLNAEFAIKLIF